MAKRDYYEVPKNRSAHAAKAIIACLCAGSLAPSLAAAETGSGANGNMQQLHRSLLQAEKDLVVAVRGRDFSRAKSVNEELRFSKAMRPTDEALRGWFREGSSAYRKHMTDCEQEIGSPLTSRSLPDKLPGK